MKNMLQLQFKNFITLQRGFDLPKKDRVLGNYPVVASTAINGYHAEHKVQPPGVVTGRSGSLGEVLYIDKPFWPLNTTLWVKDFIGNLPLYVYYFLKTLDLKQYNSGAGVPTLNRNHLDTLEIAIHDFQSQHKIATILSVYDDLIENNLRRIKILEEMAQTLYREWFVKFHFPGHEKTRMVDSPLGKIPGGWEVNKVGGLLEKVRRKKKLNKQYYETDGPIPVVDQGSDFIGGYTTDPETLFDSPLPIIVFGDHTRILKYVDFPFACGADGTQLLRPNTEQMPISLFYYVLKSIDLLDFAYARHFKFLKEQEVLIPNEQIAQLFAQVADPMRNLIRCLLSRNTKLRSTRDLLLPKLISGELDVSDLDIKTGGHVQ